MALLLLLPLLLCALRAHGQDPEMSQAPETLPYDGNLTAANAVALAAVGGLRKATSTLTFKTNRGRVFTQVNLQLGRFNGVTWRGWGTSLAWFANFAGGLPPQQLNVLLDLLFHRRRGLGLNIVRYIIPGGLNPSLSPYLASLKYQTSPGFRPNPSGPYDWSADRNQRNVLLGAIARGADVAEAVAYSPPWWQTISGDVAGNERGKPNLKLQHRQAFVDYIVDVVEHYVKVWNVKFKGLSPFNEPLDSWWRSGNNQEGCAFTLDEINQILYMTQAALRKRGISNVTRLVGLDEWTSGTLLAIKRFPGTFKQLLNRIEIHGYRLPTIISHPSTAGLQQFQSLRLAARRMKKEIWVAEWGPFVSIPNNPSDLDLALVQARTISEQINVIGISAFVHWQAVTPRGSYRPLPVPRKVGLIQIEFDNSVPFNPTITKQFYAQLQFSRWIRTGSKILSISGGVFRFICAAYSPRQKYLVLMVVNQRSTFGLLVFNRQLNLKVTSLSPQGQRVLIYRTSATEDYRQVYNKVIARTFGDIAPIHVLPMSINTYVFTNVLVH